MIYYILISYIVGITVFLADTIIAPKGLAFHGLGFRLLLVAASPLVAWHGVLHYGQFAYCKLFKRPVKFKI